MGEPLTRTDGTEGGGEEPLARAARRLQGALDALDAALERRPAASTTAPPVGHDRADALVIELDAARRHGRALASAATQASVALARAAGEVRRTLDEDAERQGVLALDDADGEAAPPQPLEIEAEPAQGEGAAAPAEEDPAA